MSEATGSSNPPAGPRTSVDGRHAEVKALLAAALAAPPIKVPGALRDPHPLVAAMIEADSRWLARNERFRTSIRERRAGVSRPLLGRAYRVTNAVVRAADERGFSLSAARGDFDRAITMTAFGEKYGLLVYEPCVQRPRVLSKQELDRKAKYGSAFQGNYVPSGELCLQLRSEWGSVHWQVRDGKRMRIEDRLNKFFVAVLRQVDYALECRRARELSEARAREDGRRRLEQERATKLEGERIDRLLRAVDSWRRSREIRAYLRRIRHVVAKQGRVVEPGGELDRWLHWAEEVADRMDPLAATPARG